MSESKWTTTVVTEFLRTGTYRPGSMRVFRSDTPPPPAEENWPRAEKFGGTPTHVFIFRSVASTSWNVDRGYAMLPAEFAKFLIRGGHARLARPEKIPVGE